MKALVVLMLATLATAEAKTWIWIPNVQCRTWAKLYSHGNVHPEDWNHEEKRQLWKGIEVTDYTFLPNGAVQATTKAGNIITSTQYIIQEEPEEKVVSGNVVPETDIFENEEAVDEYIKNNKGTDS